MNIERSDSRTCPVREICEHTGLTNVELFINEGEHKREYCEYKLFVFDPTRDQALVKHTEMTSLILVV
jgi:hypothetical protein